MAVEIGTATGHVDLYNKLYTFLTSDSELVAEGQQWERVATVGTEPPWAAGGTSHADPEAAVMLKGPGLAGQDEVYVSMSLRTLAATQRGGFYIAGHFGVAPAVATFLGHINSSAPVGVPLRVNQAMKYWFVANGRRFAGVIEVGGGVYMSFYAGLYLPYATPAGNPYPMAIGGSMRGDRSFADTWVTDTNSYLGSFVDPWGIRPPAGLTPGSLSGSSLYVVSPDGLWNTFANAEGYDSDISSKNPADRNGYNGVHPFGSAALPRALAYANASGTTPPGSGGVYRYLRSCYLRAQRPMLGGGYLLTPLTLFASRYHAGVSPVPSGVWGVLQGFHQVAGFGNAAENTITVGGVDHLVSRIAHRQGNDCFFTMALE